MDTLTLKGLQYHAPHGYYKEERQNGNNFEVDLIFQTDLKAAAQQDDLTLTIDYQNAEQIVRNVMEGPSVKLIETLAQQIGEHLFNRFSNVQKIEVAIRKLVPPLKTPTAYSEVRMTWPQ